MCVMSFNTTLLPVSIESMSRPVTQTLLATYVGWLRTYTGLCCEDGNTQSLNMIGLWLWEHLISVMRQNSIHLDKCRQSLSRW